ncbi:hypothetical protein ElyMa_004319900 [Elysia marginata]|uniref:Uncharacterized protein n=1 Tax=Elysia marginata TaxID=1093978 RepID=A0AAV4H0A0_9GAST|nr:hypothetical protein ElyMa_004319900 [Elysia marginata]
MNRHELHLSTRKHRSCYSICRTDTSKSLDINADFYIRGREVDPRSETSNRYFRPRSVLARLEHLCLLRMPSSIFLVGTMTYTGVIFVCGLISEMKKNGTESPHPKPPKSLGASAQREYEASGSTSTSSKLETCHSQSPYESSLNKKKMWQSLRASLLPTNQKLSNVEEPTLTSAILASCFRPTNFRDGRTVILDSISKINHDYTEKQEAYTDAPPVSSVFRTEIGTEEKAVHLTITLTMYLHAFELYY